MYSGASAASASTVKGSTVENLGRDQASASSDNQSVVGNPEIRLARLERARQEQEELAARQERSFQMFLQSTAYSLLLSNIKSQLFPIFGDTIKDYSLPQILQLQPPRDKKPKTLFDRVIQEITAQISRAYYDDVMLVKDFVAAFGATASSVYLQQKHEVEQEKERLEAEIINNQTELTAIQAEIQSQKGSLTEMTAANTALEDKKNELERQLAKNTEALQTVEVEKARLEAETAALHEQNQALTTKIQSKESELDTLQSRIAALEEETKEKETEKKALESMIVSLKQTAGALEVQLETATEDRARLQGKNEALNETIGGLEIRVRTTAREIADRNQQLDEARAQVANLTFQLEESRLERSRMQGRSGIDHEQGFFKSEKRKSAEHDRDNKLFHVLSARKFAIIRHLVEVILPDVKENSEQTNLVTLFIYNLLWQRNVSIVEIMQNPEFETLRDWSIITETNTVDDNISSRANDVKYNQTIRQVLEPGRSNGYLPTNLTLAAAFTTRKNDSAMPDIVFEEQQPTSVLQSRS